MKSQYMGRKFYHMREVKMLSLFLGVISFLFGILKFVSPFKDWYLVQIKTSGLPQFMYFIGIAGEIVVGIAFLFPFLVLRVSARAKRNLLIFANASFIMILLGASIVHLIPTVPASVLPLKIKPPVIPLAFAFITLYNLVNTVRKTR